MSQGLNEQIQCCYIHLQDKELNLALQEWQFQANDDDGKRTEKRVPSSVIDEKHNYRFLNRLENQC